MKNQNEINSIKQMIAASEENIRQARQTLARLEGKTEENFQNENRPSFFSIPQTGKTIEGVFNGEVMIDSEEKSYPVPANYASKSKLVEGDSLKLTITNDGSFVYKQIGPVLRKRLVGHLAQDETGQYFVLANGRSYKVLSASVTYFKAKKNDEVVVLVPQEKEAGWAVIENLASSLDKNLAENENQFVEEKMEEEDLENSKKDFEKDNNDEEKNESEYEDKDENEKDKNSDEEKNDDKEDEEEDLIDDPAKSIKDEWTPDLEEIKKEASDDFLGGITKKFHI